MLQTEVREGLAGPHAGPKRAEALPGEVWLLDDDPAVGAALATMLRGAGHAAVAFTGADAFVAAMRAAAPDAVGVMAIDVRLGAADGCAVLERLRADGNRVPAILFSGFADVPLAVRALRAGAVDFFEKPVDAGALLAAVRRVLATPRYDYARLHLPARTAVVIGRLTPRERDVMALMLRGYSNKEIALELGISFRTVEIHRARIFDKTETRHLAELIARLFTPPSVGA